MKASTGTVGFRDSGASHEYEGQHRTACITQQNQKNQNNTQSPPMPPQLLCLARPDFSNSATLAGAFSKFSAGSHVLSQGPYPFQLTRYSTRFLTSLFAVTASTSNSCSSVSGLKTGVRRPGGAPSWRLRAETWCTSWIPRKSAGSCNRKLTGETCETTEKGPHHRGANLRERRPCKRKLDVCSQQ